MATKGLLICLTVLEGMEEEADQFLQKMILPVGTLALFVLRFKNDSYGIFGVFNSNKNREFFLRSATMKEVEQQKEILFTGRPIVQKMDILADKIPATIPAEPDQKGFLMIFKAKERNEFKMETFLRKAKMLVEKELETTSWFSFSMDNGDYGIFDVFPDNNGRIKHLTGKVPKKMIKKAGSILGSIPHMHLLTVVNESFASDIKFEEVYNTARG